MLPTPDVAYSLLPLEFLLQKKCERARLFDSLPHAPDQRLLARGIVPLALRALARLQSQPIDAQVRELLLWLPRLAA